MSAPDRHGAIIAQYSRNMSDIKAASHNQETETLLLSALLKSFKAESALASALMREEKKALRDRKRGVTTGQAAPGAKRLRGANWSETCTVEVGRWDSMSAAADCVRYSVKWGNAADAGYNEAGNGNGSYKENTVMRRTFKDVKDNKILLVWEAATGEAVAYTEAGGEEVDLTWEDEEEEEEEEEKGKEEVKGKGGGKGGKKAQKKTGSGKDEEKQEEETEQDEEGDGGGGGEGGGEEEDGEEGQGEDEDKDEVARRHHQVVVEAFKKEQKKVKDEKKGKGKGKEKEKEEKEKEKEEKKRKALALKVPNTPGNMCKILAQGPLQDMRKRSALAKAEDKARALRLQVLSHIISYYLILSHIISYYIILSHSIS
jgi:hypothetical protein